MALQLIVLRITITANDDGEEINNVVDYAVVYDDAFGGPLDVMDLTANGWEGFVTTEMSPLVVNDCTFTKLTIDDLTTPNQYQVVRNLSVQGGNTSERLPKGNCLYIAKKSSSRDRRKNGGFYMFPPGIDHNTAEGRPTVAYVASWLAFWESVRLFENGVGLVNRSSMIIKSQVSVLETDVESFVAKTDTWAFLKSRSGRAKKKTQPIVP